MQSFRGQTVLRPRGPATCRPASLGLVLGLVLFLLAQVGMAQVDYSRPVDVAPNEEAIGEGYVTPEVQRPPVEIADLIPEAS